jgi:hypothetical protein
MAAKTSEEFVITRVFDAPRDTPQGRCSDMGNMIWSPV